MLHVLTQPKSLPEKYQPRPSFLDLTPLRYPLCMRVKKLRMPRTQINFSLEVMNQDQCAKSERTR